MFIEQSSYAGAIRIRVMEQVRLNGRWKKRLLEHVGTAHSEVELEILLGQAREIVDTKKQPGQLLLTFAQTPEQRSHLRTAGEYWEGVERVLGGLFDEFEFSIRKGDLRLLRYLVIARIMHPVSKRRTAAWLIRYLHATYSVDDIYRFMDRLHIKKSKVTTGMRQYITNRYPQTLQYLLYDVTTIYWESEEEDLDEEEIAGLRKRGYSKDHREDLPQVVMGLAVNTLGMPLDCQLYPGNTYEGKTLLHGVNGVRKAVGLEEATIVADAGMLSNDNLREIEKSSNLYYIVGSRLKQLPRAIQHQILGHDYLTKPLWEIPLGKRRLVVSYSEKRAKRAQKRREQSIIRLQRLIASNRAIRKHAFLDITIAEHPRLNQQAIADAAAWDGIKGYITNNPALSPTEAIARYSELHRVEQSFRMSKTDLRIRPAYHHVRERIEAHVLVCMVSLCLMRILEEILEPLSMTIGDGLRTLESAKGSILELKGKFYTIPPLYSPTMENILNTLNSRPKPPPKI